MITKPMLADKIEDLDKLIYPMWVTPKLDGIRAVKVGGKLLSRTFKPIQNVYIREFLEAILPDGIDGEIISGKNFQETTKAVMTRKGEPSFTFYAFDYVKESLDKPYMAISPAIDCRMGDLAYLFACKDLPNCELLWPRRVNDFEEFSRVEEEFYSQGYEGTMSRTTDSPYKCGRASDTNQWLLKFKRWMDSEAEIIGLEEKTRNANEAKKDAFGRTERSSHKDNLVPTNTLGAFLVKDVHNGVEFRLGTGFTAQERIDYWDEKYIGEVVCYRFQEFGVKDLPRCPSFKGFRHRDDFEIKQ